jgi:lysyl-tRNA synthetase class 2
MEGEKPEVPTEAVEQQAAEVAAEGATEGAKLSKNEQKRLEKLKKLEAEKAAKEAKKAELAKDKPVPAKGNKPEEILDPTQYFENRSKMIAELKKSPETDPYPHKFHVAQTVPEFIKKYAPITVKGQWLEEETSIAGRIYRIRYQGKSLVFIDMKQDGEALQVMCNANNFKGVRSFDEVIGTLRRGDIVGIVGKPGRTNTE